jgi:U3 small nucleolar RNA-associated protein 13
LYSGADDGSVRVWDLETRGCRVLQNHLSAVTGLAFVDNGNAVVSVGRDKVVNLWNLHTHALTRTIPVFEVRNLPPPHQTPMPHFYASFG